MRVMLDATFFASQEAVRHMRTAATGSIINVSSIAASRVVPESPSYHAAKAGVVAITRYLAAVAGPWGIRVNCIEPGFIVKDEHQSQFNADDNRDYRSLAVACHPLRRTGYSDEVAEAILFLASDAARFITGQSIVVDGGLTLQEPFSLASAILRDRAAGRGAA
jgi:NAD(P)-dependent dehydrogenase (short-subunit alcohol dehydrogenase family)